jgi:hypothetical protein
MSTEIEQVSQALAGFDAVSAGIAELRTRYAGVVYDVTTPDGMADAKAARQAVREPRYEVERICKAAKAPIIALGKKLDADAARITAEIEKIEAPIDRQIKAEEARKEAERQAKIAAEERRVRDIQTRVAELRGNQMLTPASGSALIAQHITDLETIAVDESFEEFREQAADAKAGGLARLRELHGAALAHEAEQVRLAAERAELARLRAEQEARDRAERERIAAERREQEAAAAAEAERLAAERAELERQRAAMDSTAKFVVEATPGGAAMAVPPGRAISDNRPSDAEIVEALALHFRVHEVKVIEWLAAMDLEAAFADAARDVWFAMCQAAIRCSSSDAPGKDRRRSQSRCATPAQPQEPAPLVGALQPDHAEQRHDQGTGTGA